MAAWQRKWNRRCFRWKNWAPNEHGLNKRPWKKTLRRMLPFYKTRWIIDECQKRVYGDFIGFLREGSKNKPNILGWRCSYSLKTMLIPETFRNRRLLKTPVYCGGFLIGSYFTRICWKQQQNPRFHGLSVKLSVLEELIKTDELWFSLTECRCNSFTVKVALDFVIYFLFSELDVKFLLR